MTVKRVNFDSEADWDEYIAGLSDGELANCATLSAHQKAWSKRIPGLCAGDYAVKANPELHRPPVKDIKPNKADDYHPDDFAVGEDIPAMKRFDEMFDSEFELDIDISDCEVEAMAEVEHARRKAQPVWTGFVCYFPDAMGKVAELSLIANEQHHPGTPLHWDKSKSQDHMDCLMRHGIDDLKGRKMDNDKVWHKTKVAWRAMAELQEECDRQDSTARIEAQYRSDDAFDKAQREEYDRQAKALDPEWVAKVSREPETQSLVGKAEGFDVEAAEET